MLKRKTTTGLYNAYREKVQSDQNGMGILNETQRAGVSGREDICVFSLNHGTGTSYISAAISNYLSCYRKGKVALVLNDTAFADEVVSPRVNVASWENETEAFICSNYVVHDMGVFEEFSQERRTSLQRGTKKILLCRGDGAYLTKLAAFVESEKTEDIVFLFNQLPKEWEKRAFELMDFTRKVFCIPTFFSVRPDKQVVRLMEELLM